MSTVPEVIVANQMRFAVGGISCISNRAAGLSDTRLSHQEVMEETEKASKRFSRLLAEAIPLVAAAVRKMEKARAEREADEAPVSVGYRMTHKGGR